MLAVKRPLDESSCLFKFTSSCLFEFMPFELMPVRVSFDIVSLKKLHAVHINAKTKDKWLLV